MTGNQKVAVSVPLRSYHCALEQATYYPGLLQVECYCNKVMALFYLCCENIFNLPGHVKVNKI